MDRTALLRHLGEDWPGTEEAIASALSTDIPLLERMNGAILSPSGKQLRPILCLLSARACSGGRTTPASIEYAAASELLHNATLIHDDVADNSDTRRGFPTALSLLGASSAVLLGDFWLARAVRMLVRSGCREDVQTLFTKTLSDLAEGEMLQLEKAELADTTEDDYFRIIYFKTASLFEAACVAGAMSVGAGTKEQESVREYAVSLGIAFQIKDDILDYTGKEELGKPLGADLREQKITLPLLGALRGSAEEEKMRRKILLLPSKPELAEEIREFVLSSGGVEYASRCLDSYVEKAVAALRGLPPSADRDYLEQIARYNSSRTL